MAGTPFAKTVARMLWIDVRQIARHGWGAPRWAERLWIDPRRCATVATELDRSRTLSGQLRGGDWAVAPILSVEKVRMAEEHWRTGASWEAVGAHDYLRAHVEELGTRDGYRTDEDIRRRFERLDELFEAVRREGRLRPRSELPGRSVREHRGIYVHIDAQGDPVFGNGGCHRLAIARVLELPAIPVQLGVLHPRALPLLPALRSPDHG